jgi:predicted metal-dependent hydrolase
MTNSCHPAPEELFHHGVELFNREEYFECHEVWEHLWKQQDEGQQRQFTQGLIQVAVATYHLRRQNFTGALRLYERALGRLRPCSPSYCGIDVAALIAQVETVVKSPVAEFSPRISVTKC